jgi:hemerythrin-like metal-binding protein
MGTLLLDEAWRVCYSVRPRLPASVAHVNLLRAGSSPAGKGPISVCARPPQGSGNAAGVPWHFDPKPINRMENLEMAFLNWTPDLSVGIDRIDQQHKKIVALLNELYEAMQAGQGREALGKVLNDLLLYTKTHFAAEEQAMAAHGYPDYEEHRRRHEKMALKVKELHAQFRDGSLTSPIQITNFLKDWLAKHIRETDKKYGPFLAAQGGV